MVSIKQIDNSMIMVKTRKEHICDHCNGLITIGSNAMFYSVKGPKYDNEMNQIGIEYHKGYLHYNPDIDCIS